VPMRYASMKLLDKHLLAALAIIVSIGSASAQSSGSGGSSSGSGSAGSASGTTGGATSPGSPALGSTPSGPVTPNRSNSEIFPPSRLAPRPGGSIPGTSTSTTPSNQSGTTQNGSGTNGSNTQDPTTAGSGRVPSPATGGAGGSTKTGKNPALDTVADCMKIWDAGTHMSKADWARTCRRVQGRLDDLKDASERQ
jgi:hypothetical protein